MYAAERRRLILEELTSTGRITVADLSARHEVATETIRRDLDELADRGLLERVHGGAIPRREAEPDLEARRVTHIDAKRRIALAAAALLPRDEQAAPRGHGRRRSHRGGHGRGGGGGHLGVQASTAASEGEAGPGARPRIRRSPSLQYGRSSATS